MKIGSIFAVVKIGENLFSIQYEDTASHIFEELFDNWTDVEYLFKFFNNNQEYLHQPFWESLYHEKISVTKALEITLDLAEKMEDFIIKYADSGANSNYLSRIFYPLVNDNVFHKPLKSAYKAYGPNKTSWLRVYAIKIEDNYIITGGAIKLTKTMQESPNTQQELARLQSVASELKRLHFTDNSDFDFVYLEI